MMATKVHMVHGSFSVTGASLASGHRIRIEVDVSAQPPPTQPIRIIGGATVAIERSGSAFQTLGFAHQTSIRVLSPENPRQALDLAIDLNREQLEAIEVGRDGKSVTVVLDPAIHLLSDDAHVTSLTAQERFNVSPAQWSTVLDQCRFADAFVFTIPLGDSGSLTSRAAEDLRSARKAIDEGRYEYAIASARKVVEQLWRKDAGATLVERKGQSRDKRDRLHAIADAIYDVSSLAIHADELAAETEWTRSDAVCVVAAVSVLLANSTISTV